MTEICLVRHGQTDWNLQEIIQGREDIPLNETGRLQAAQSADLLRQESWDIVVSSPLGRARETAQAIAAAIGMDEVYLDERFIERNFGAASGRPTMEVRDSIAAGTVADMESEEEIVERCFAALCDIARQHQGKRIVIVAHAHAIKAMLHAIAPDEVHFRTPLENACANYVRLQEGEWSILRYNVADHIQV
ncbi:histidine phosphatase family protein [Ectobacillus ponti]|uniref:Histidine phosphatase family protein n=1 Tax=Ectobacillus ponti TaxID=2961894 RepID=A0AA42BS75_9BACI|nr:histidine phosphatase family protein [Ectobacillus ponti]MCP8970269.1 histidine phosphatase family protein [Ectobacillus ponti]